MVKKFCLSVSRHLVSITRVQTTHLIIKQLRYILKLRCCFFLFACLNMYFGLGLAYQSQNTIDYRSLNSDEYGSSKVFEYLDNFCMDTDIDFFPHHFAIQHLVLACFIFKTQLKLHVIPRSKCSSTHLVVIDLLIGKVCYS